GVGDQPPAQEQIECAELSALLARNEATVIDLSPSREYRKAHIPGAWFAIRSRLARALPKIEQRRELVLTSEDGILAGLAVPEARALAGGPVRALRGGNAAWQAAGLPLPDDARTADEPADLSLTPYAASGRTAAAGSEYRARATAPPSR